MKCSHCNEVIRDDPYEFFPAQERQNILKDIHAASNVLAVNVVKGRWGMALNAMEHLEVTLLSMREKLEFAKAHWKEE